MFYFSGTLITCPRVYDDRSYIKDATHRKRLKSLT